MQFDIVVATRNRVELLAPTLRSIMTQSRLPERLIVVDSSDDPEPVAALVESLTPGLWSRTIHAEPGLTRQRNIGLREVVSPVVMFPDDDVIWAPGVADAVMRVYERDSDRRVAGVVCREVHEPPAGYPEAAANTAAKSLSTRLVYRFSSTRAFFEQFIQKNPMLVRGDELSTTWDAPAWLPEVRARIVSHMIGFRMTFRTEAIRAAGFDETLHAYALYEDNDASLTALRSGLLVEAERALVFHNRAPGQRTATISGGAMLLLNLAYVACKHSPVGSDVRKAIPKYARLRGMQYRLRAGDAPGKARLEGFRRAMKQLPALLEAEGEDLAARYTAATKACAGE